MSGFKRVTETLNRDGETWHVNVPDNWTQGRTLYGGITTGLCYAAAVRNYDNLPPLRSCQISFVGPVTDNPHIQVHRLRQGRNVTAIQVEMTVNEHIVATANMLFGQGRTSKLALDCPAPHAPMPEDTPLFFPKEFSSLAPAFTHNFDVHLIDGHRPITGSKQGYIRTWARHKDPASWEGLGGFLTLADVLPPAALPMFTQMGPVSSMNWQINILDDEPTTENGWWQVENTLTAASGGYSSQIMRYWNRAGKLCAEAIQSVTIFI